MARVTVRDLARMKARGERIPMLTAYDYTAARLADQAGIPIILVGDSLGMVVLGYESTLPVTMDDMIHHTKMVVRGAQNAHVVADLPFMSYQINNSQALTNAARLVQEGGAQSVKLEGGERVAETVRSIVDCGIPVMGHIGLTPQSVNAFSGYRVRGRDRQEAIQMLQDAQAIEDAGAYAVVLELVPTPLAQLNLPEVDHTYHRYRGGTGLRRPGTGAPRYAGPFHRFCSSPRQAVRQTCGHHARSLPTVCAGG